MKKSSLTAALALTMSAGLGLAGIGVGHVHAEATLPSTDTMYVISCDGSFDDLTLFSVTSDGSATAIGNGNGNLDGKCPLGAAWDAKGQQAYFLSTDVITFQLELWTTDRTTGVPTKVSDITPGDGSYLSFDADGAAQTQYDGVFYNLDMTTYTETEIASSQVNPDNGFYYVVQAFNPADGKLYAINADNTEDDGPPIPNMIYTVDPTTGVVYGNTGPQISGILPDTSEIGQLGSIAFDSAGTGWAIVGEDLYSFDPATGEFTRQGPITNGSGFTGSSLSLFIAGPAQTPTTLPPTGSNPVLAVLSASLAFVGVAAVAMSRRRVAA